MSTESYIIDGARSPIGLKNGELVGARSDDLTAMVIKGLMKRNSSIPPESIEDVVVGCAFPEVPRVCSWPALSLYSRVFLWKLEER